MKILNFFFNLKNIYIFILFLNIIFNLCITLYINITLKMSRKKLTYKEGNLIIINIIIYLKSNKWQRESNNRLWK